MGLSWLAIIYGKMGNVEKTTEYLKRADKTVDQKGLIRELWYSYTTKANENNPLGWAESMYGVALVVVRDLLQK